MNSTEMKKAIITGITGQDASYLAEFLLEKNYKVYGTYRPSSTTNFWRIETLGIKDHPNLFLVEYDLTDPSDTIRLISTIKPDEIYNLAAQSFVGISFNQPIATSQINAIGPLYILEAIRNIDPTIKFYQASTSEMFGKVQCIPQDENTPLYPRSPYGIAKQFAHWMTINYRESYNMFCTCGILFNHESPLRGKEFITRKITDGLVRVKEGLIPFIELGNIYSKRDWGYAKDYIKGMWMMLQVDIPDTYVLSTGILYSIKDFISYTCEFLDIDLYWEGEGLDEIGIDRNTGKTIIKINSKFYRPCEVDLLVGDYSKAKEELGFEPKVELREICKMMVEHDLKIVRKEIRNL